MRQKNVKTVGKLKKNAVVCGLNMGVLSGVSTNREPKT